MTNNRPNYLPSTGNAANWAEGMSSSLADLSKSLLAQGDRETSRLERLTEIEENRKERELNRSDLLAAREEAKKQYQDQKARQAAQDAIAAATEKRNADEFNRQREEAAIVKNFSGGYSFGQARWNAFNENPELKSLFEQDVLNAKKLLAESIYSQHAVDQAGAEKSKLGSTSGLTRKDIPENPLEAILKLKESDPNSPLVQKFLKAEAELDTTVKEYVTSNMPIYSEGESALLYKQLIGKGVSPQTAQTVAAHLANGLDSKSNLTKEALARQQTANKAAEEAARRALDAYKLYVTQPSSSNQQGTSQGSSKDSQYTKVPRGYISNVDAEEKISNMGTGTYDKHTLYKQWEAAVASGVDPQTALAAIGSAVNIGFWSKDVKFDTPAEFVTFAKVFEASSKKSDGKQLSLEEIKALGTPQATPYVSPEEENLRAFIGGLQSRLPNKNTFRGLLLPETLPPPKAKPINIKEVMSSLPKERNINTMSREELLDSAKSLVAETVGPNFNLPNPGTPYSAQTQSQRLSKELLDEQLQLYRNISGPLSDSSRKLSPKERAQLERRGIEEQLYIDKLVRELQRIK